MPPTTVKEPRVSSAIPAKGGAKRPTNSAGKKPSGIGQDRLRLSSAARSGAVAEPPAASPPIAQAPEPPLQPVAPLPPVVSDPLQAIETALQDKPVRFKSLAGEPELLTIKPAGTAGDLAEFDIALGKHGLRLTLPQALADPAHMLESLRVIYRIPDQFKGALRAMQIHGQDDYSARIVDLAGQEQTVAIRKTGTTKEGAITYHLALGSYELAFQGPPENDISQELAQAVHLYLGIPPHLRFALKSVHIDNAANPTDAYWAEKYNIKDFTSAATGGNGVANFWHGTRYFADSYFFHEFGHVIGQLFSTKNLLIPDGWEEKIAADDRAVSEYGKTSPAEDFAESWMLYSRCRSGQPPYSGGDPATVAEFNQRFPNRSRVLETIYDGSLKPVFKGNFSGATMVIGLRFLAA